MLKEYSVDDIKTCMVLIITHQRYIEACSEELAASFGERDTLIIDEQLQFPITKYGRAEYNDMRNDIHLYEGQVLFDKCLYLYLRNWIVFINQETITILLPLKIHLIKKH